MIVFFRCREVNPIRFDPEGALLCANVELLMTPVLPPTSTIPPAWPPPSDVAAVLSLTVLRSIDRLTLAGWLKFAIPPPAAPFAVPPVALTVLLLTVLRTIVSAPSLPIPPPFAFVVPPEPAMASALFESTVERLTVNVPRFMMPAPAAEFWDVAPLPMAVLPRTALRTRLRVPLFSIPPPSEKALAPPVPLAVLEVTATAISVRCPLFKIAPPCEPHAGSQRPWVIVRPEIEMVPESITSG